MKNQVLKFCERKPKAAEIEKSGLAYGHDIFTGNQGSILVGRGNRKVPTAREWSCKPPCTPPIRMDPDLIHRPPFQTVATFSADHMRSGLHADRSERVRYAERTDVANGGTRFFVSRSITRNQSIIDRFRKWPTAACSSYFKWSTSSISLSTCLDISISVCYSAR